MSIETVPFDPWLSWRFEYWATIEAELGPSGMVGNTRRFNDVIIFIVPWGRLGQCNFIVEDVYAGGRGADMPHWHFNEKWIESDPHRLAGSTLKIVDEIRAEPMHRLMKRSILVANKLTLPKPPS